MQKEVKREKRVSNYAPNTVSIFFFFRIKDYLELYIVKFYGYMN